MISRGATALALGVALGATSQVAYGQAFTEDFNDGLAGSRWTIVSQQEIDATDPEAINGDGSVNFNFNYSSLGIPNPSGNSDSIGAYIQVNNTDQAGNEGESYSIFPNLFDLPNADWRIDVDMFVYNDGSAGTSEFGHIGAYLNRANPVSPYQFGTNGGPLAWEYSGEGGAANDIATFENGGPGNTGFVGLGDYETIAAGSIPGFQTGAALAVGPAESDPRGSWVAVAIEQTGSTISWSLNGVVVDSYDNSGGTYTSGTFLLGAQDPFNSSNLGTGAILDNVVVTVVPEPGSLALLGLAGLCVLRRRQRN